MEPEDQRRQKGRLPVLTKDEVKEILALLKDSKKVDFKRITKRQAQALVNQYAEALAPFTMEEVLDALRLNYLPPIATERDMARLLKNLVDDCQFNRLAEVEQVEQRKEAIRRWYEVCGIDYNDLPF